VNEGAVVLVVLPQADGDRKTRPAVVLRAMPPFGAWLVCGISTQLHHAVGDFDEVIGPEDADYRISGLKAVSLIRLGFLAVLSGAEILGEIGSLSPDRHQRLLGRLSRHLLAGAVPAPPKSER
jgi:mRNA interferase MazF